jgi:putative ABC transport system permease protein
MLRNYLKTGFRNLFRHKRYAAINIIGLAIGVASCLLISMFVKDEFTYDRYHTKVDSIYNLSTVGGSTEKEVVFNAVSYPEAKTYFEDVPEIINFTRMRREGAVVKVGEDVFDEKGLMFSDRGFFEMFDFKVLDGALDETLTNLTSVVITESAALKYFGRANVSGEELYVKVRDEFESFIVTAVIEDHPSNSSFTFNMMMSWNKLETIIDSWSMNQWFITPALAYVLLDEKADSKKVESKMLKSRLLHNDGEEQFNDIARKNSNKLIPLIDYYFERRGGDEKKSQSQILAGIAILILIIACFNFSTLTIVNSISRAKEVGVRKTIGANKEHLVFQFLCEALILCSISFLLGVIMAEITLPLFETMVEKQFSYNLFDDYFLLLSVFLITLLVSILSILYPSLYLSQLRVIKVFSGNMKLGGKQLLTKSMVTLQFLFAFIFITVAVAINQQHKFLINKDKGYDDKNLIRLKIPNNNSDQVAQRFKNELSQYPFFLSVGAVNDLNEAISLKDTLGNSTMMIKGNVDMDYLKTLGIEIKEGRDFTTIDQANVENNVSITNVLINESAIKNLGIEEPLGHLIDDGRYRVIGVINDYQIFSAKSRMSSIMLRASAGEGRELITNNIFIRYKESNLLNGLQVLEQTWNKILPSEPFNYTFIDEYNANLYKKEALWSKTLSYSSGLAIAVSLMGLLGLVGLTASQRKKEVSIRKVMGASVANLVLLLNQGFTKLLLLSIVLSVPITYFIIDKFLQDYINRIEITVVLFIVPLLVTFLVAWMTVSSITFKSATRNPIDDLRYE